MFTGFAQEKLHNIGPQGDVTSPVEPTTDDAKYAVNRDRLEDELLSPSGERSLIDSAKAILAGHIKGTLDPINKERLKEVHDCAYYQQDANVLDARDIGSAAGLQTFNQITAAAAAASGESHSDVAASFAEDPAAHIAHAINESGKLFESLGGAAGGGTKEDAANSAATTVARLMAQSLGTA